ncbi:PDR/VanB family oxidoreductase [Sphingobium jiangsuense]|nr:PDR/VanB family oxidoreductase [Sphingobium jiangsuense]
MSHISASEPRLDQEEAAKWLRLKVVNRRIVARDIVAFDLEDPAGEPLPVFAAGAHVDVRAGDGLIRQYSLCNDPRERHRYRLGILLDPQSRGGSAAIHAGFAEGELVDIGMPRNLFPIRDKARPALLFGGGIGITPILAMAHELEAAGASFALHYCVRDASRAAFLDEIGAGALAPHCKVHFDDGAAEQRLDVAALLAGADRRTDLYVCGPAGFIDHVRSEARRVGWPDDQIHSESFDAAVDLSGGSFELIAERSGRRFIVPPGKSPAQVLLDAGIDVPVSCEQGICGTCLCDVLEGTPDHRDLIQSDEEKASNKQIALCCSRSLTPVLRIDL